VFSTKKDSAPYLCARTLFTAPANSAASEREYMHVDELHDAVRMPKSPCSHLSLAVAYSVAFSLFSMAEFYNSN